LSIRHVIPVFAGGVISDSSVKREFALPQHGSDGFWGLDLIFNGIAMHLNYNKQAFYKIDN
jgi:hypothetical protein